MNRLNAQTRPRRALLPLLALTAAMLLVEGCGQEGRKCAARPPAVPTRIGLLPTKIGD